MTRYKIDFESLPWDKPFPGLRVKLQKSEDRQIRVVEFSREFIEIDWCRKGHIGYVLEGRLEIDFNGKRETFGPGDGLFIPAGEEHKHKPKAITDTVKLVFVEDV